jgi:serine/threonine-protein kinase HipA
LALGPEVGLRATELDDFALAFEHEQIDAAATLLGW